VWRPPERIVALASGEFFIPPMVAAIVDEFLGRSEVGGGRLHGYVAPRRRGGTVQVDVRHEQPHGAALGDFHGFVQVGLR